MVAKIVMLVLMTICALLAVFGGLIFSKSKYNDLIRNRKIMKFRLICFVLMFVFLLICMLI